MILGNLEPEKVFCFFEEISKIPHGSGNTKQISDYLVNFAQKRGLDFYQDSFNNVIIFKDASKECKNSDAVIIQGHMDMVCEKAPHSKKDMEKEVIDLKTDGDFIYADGTTLGGDDGIAVAYALAILDSSDIIHPPLEVVITVDEETGMTGATNLDCSRLKGKKLINIDSEDEGIFTTSCAGGNVTKCHFDIAYEEQDGTFFEITINGLTGGHSGVEIDKFRANSNILMGRLLSALWIKNDIKISSVNGGLKDNAIPVETRAIICTNDEEKTLCLIEKMEQAVKNEYNFADKNVKITVEKVKKVPVLDYISTKKVIALLGTCPNGIQEMSSHIKGLVQTSLNLGIVETKGNEFVAKFCVRSSIESQKEMLSQRLFTLMKALDGKCEISGDYPGWEYKEDSSLRRACVDAYKELYKKEPVINAIHAGLECGVFSGKIKDLDCISYGPDLFDIHTYREKMSISSVKRVWEFTLLVLKKLSE